MMVMIKRFYQTIFTLAILSVTSAQAQDIEADIDAAATQYNLGQYTASAQALETLAANDARIDPRLIAQVYKYLAFNYIAMGQMTRASNTFRTALFADPTLTLGEDAVIAPKIRQVFAPVQRETLALLQTNDRRQTLWRSLLLPGWGQYYRGEHLKGYGFMAAYTSVLGGLGFSIYQVNSRWNRYVNFGENDAVAIYSRRQSIEDLDAALRSRYNAYTSSIDRTNLLTGLAIGLWSVNMIDVLLFGPDNRYNLSRAMNPEKSGMAMAWNPVMRQWVVGYQMKW